MEHASLPPIDTRHLTPKSSMSSLPSPTMSSWSRGHSTKSSISSISSSPLPYRDSLDVLYSNAKRLEDVREEPHEPEAEDSLESSFHSSEGFHSDPAAEHLSHGWSSTSLQYSLDDAEQWSDPSYSHQPKRQRSIDLSRHSMQGFGSRFGSISKRWKHRSAAGPQLSLVTHTAQTGLSRSRSDVTVPTFSHIHGVKAGRDNHVPPSPSRSAVDVSIDEVSEVVPTRIDEEDEYPEEEDNAQAHTPLLPPIMTDLKKQRADSPIQSPLQSPSIAPTTYVGGRVSTDVGPFSSLPSPPLSSRPSLASIPRSRQNTVTNDIPHLCLMDEHTDPWAIRLGHADFSIHPEPCMPEMMDFESYRNFRANWDQARKQYAQHLARTVEHYGDTSKVFKLTEEKWQAIDAVWKRYDAVLHNALSLSFDHGSEGPSSPCSPASSLILERPVDKVVVPPHDKTGKFPELGDSDIIGPLSIGTARVPELARNQNSPTPSDSHRKRNLVKLLSDIFNRH